MHRYDELTARVARAVFEYTDERLRLDPVPLDHGFEPDDLDARAPSLIGRSGNDPEVVMQQFRDVISPAVISCDSPRFLAFIPAAPTKASLLFDMVVSASSMSGISWLESAGAVHAENQALRFLADLAGLPANAGGCFVQGGSAANLSALAVARDSARTSGSFTEPVRHRRERSRPTRRSPTRCGSSMCGRSWSTPKPIA